MATKRKMTKAEMGVLGLKVAATIAGVWWAWNSYKKKKAASEAAIEAAKLQRMAAAKQIEQVEAVRAPDLKTQLTQEGVSAAKNLVNQFIPISGLGDIIEKPISSHLPFAYKTLLSIPTAISYYRNNKKLVKYLRHYKRQIRQKVNALSKQLGFKTARAIKKEIKSTFVPHIQYVPVPMQLMVNQPPVAMAPVPPPPLRPLLRQ